MLENTVYLVLSHIDGTYENEFLGIFSNLDRAKAFVEAGLSSTDVIAYSKITVHPIPLDKSFDFARFSENAVATFAKNEATGKLELV